MDKDFHYYGTYWAAIAAGMGNAEAAKIAFFAQFVDDCTKTTVANLQKKFKDLKTVCTSQSVDGMLRKYGINPKEFTEEELAQIEPIWTSFHFLPGGAKENDTDKSKKSELICHPNSETVYIMVANLLNKCMNEKKSYAHIGMVMHILADTWAHRNFAGIPSKDLNETGQVKDIDKKIISYSYIGSDQIDKNKLNCTPRAPRENSIVYLGHGRLGHLPDYGFAKYYYKPNWKAQELEKDNRKDFRNALYQMFYVMQCIKNTEQNSFKKNFEADADGNQECFRKEFETNADENQECFKKEFRKPAGQNQDYPRNLEEIYRILTEKKKTEEILSQLEKKTRGLPQYSVNLLFDGDDKKNLNDAKELFEEFFEAAAEHRTMVVQSFSDLIHH